VHLVRSTDYKIIVFAFLRPRRQSNRAGVIESAEVPGPVFTEPLDLEAVRKVTGSSEYRQLRALVRERIRQRSPAV
jgi:hypothetical protein